MGHPYQDQLLSQVCDWRHRNHIYDEYGLITFCDHADDLESYHILETDGQVPTHVPKVA